MNALGLSLVASEPVITTQPQIKYGLLAIAFVASAFASLFGIMAGLWGGAPSLLAFLFWFLPALSWPIWVIYLLLPKPSVFLSWLLLVGNYTVLFLGNWQEAIAGKDTTANPFAIALGCLDSSPSIPALFVVAACLHLATCIGSHCKAREA